MTVVEATNILLKIPNLTTRERTAVKTVIAMIDGKYMNKLDDSYYSLNLNDLPNEQWRDVSGYEGLYQVSTLGRVKSFHNDKIIIRKPVTLSGGYQQVSLDKNGKRKCMGIHVLVAKMFIPNPENKPMIDHYDRNPANNAVWNLRWVTNSENQRHAVELNAKRSGCDNLRSNLSPEQVRNIRQLYVRKSHEFGSVSLAKMFGVSISIIKRIVNGTSYKNIV